MNKLEEIVGVVLEEIEPQHTELTFNARKSSLNRLLRFARAHGFDEARLKIMYRKRLNCTKAGK